MLIIKDLPCLIIQINHKGESLKGKVDIIKEIIFKIKGGIITNIVKNVNHQCQAGSLTESASAFNLNRLIGLDERFNQIRKLYSLYGMNYIHSVKNIDEDMQK